MEDVKRTAVTGSLVPVTGNDIDTDRIIPARYLKEITFSRMGEYPFYDERFDEDGQKTNHPFNRNEFQGASILVANSNFGCGSSREHAPQALMRWGIKAVVAESFAEIFAGNCIMLGIPVVTADPEDIKALQQAALGDPQDRYTLDLSSLSLVGGKLSIKVNMPESRRTALTEGYWDSTSLLYSNISKTKDVFGKLPYINGFQ